MNGIRRQAKRQLFEAYLSDNEDKIGSNAFIFDPSDPEWRD